MALDGAALMAATTSGALKAYIEGLGLGLTVYRDAAPRRDDPSGRHVPLGGYPLVTIREAIAVTWDQVGDLGDAAADQTVRELAQVDLWQSWRDGTGKAAESYTLPSALARKLRGAKLVPIGTASVYMVGVSSMVRLLEEANNVVHHAITCTVYRQA